MIMAFSAPGQINSIVQIHRACDECRMLSITASQTADSHLPQVFGSLLAPKNKVAAPDADARTFHATTLRRNRWDGRRKDYERSLRRDLLWSCHRQKMAMAKQSPDTEDRGMQFINFLLGADCDLDPFPETLVATTEAPLQTRDQSWHPYEVDNFSQPTELVQPLALVSVDPAISTARTDFDTVSTDQLPASSPPTSNPASSTETGSTNPIVTTPFLPNCDCIANLYSALSLMQKLPADVEAAVCQARSAAKVAHEAVNCSRCQCSFKIVPLAQHATSAAAMQGFQTIMLLATLIPSIVHAYVRMLAAVDDETNRAMAERRNIVFKLDGLGGIWGNLRGGADSRGAFRYREMEPGLWRLAVRALMKFDVYGVSGGAQDPDGPLHLGLKDLVLQMENEARERHAFKDAMVDSGLRQQPNCSFAGAVTPGQLPICQQVISITRASIEQLQIPWVM
ncbi:hypothetical protein GGS21DRAFT_526549 [Xylaria nigripes]|nr:hypothetical protein GGS21DRAFT_526549 [Xylaria nigripes]